jgi:hypothetical protein
MAVTVLDSNLQVTKWVSSYFKEYVRESGFRPYMGAGSNAVFHVNRELVGGGKTVRIPLVTRLKGPGVTGDTALIGNEEALGNFSQEIVVDYIRHGVKIPDPDNRWGNFDLLQAARDQLMVKSMARLRDDIITALGSINGVAYASATAAQRNTWSTSNADRVLYGNAIANYTDAGATTHAARLTNIAAGEIMTANVVSLMKRIARRADPFIRPMRVNDGSGREYFIMFAPSFAFRDLKNDATMSQANREARPRDVDSNPIFQDGDLIYDGVIIREIPEIGDLGTVGAGGTVRVAPVYLCGAQTLGVAYGLEPKAIRDETDYGFNKHVGTMEVRGIEKLRFPTGAAGAFIDHGMVTGYVAAAGDA